MKNIKNFKDFGLNEGKENEFLPKTMKIFDNARTMKAPEFYKWWESIISKLKIEKK